MSLEALALKAEGWIEVPESFRTYRIFDDVLAVLSDEETLGWHIHCFMKHLEVQEASPTLRLLVLGTGEKQVALVCPELSFTRQEARGKAAWVAFRRLFTHAVANMDRPNDVLHACCAVDDRGRVAVLAGQRDAGKTTLLASLLDRGFRLVADDLCVLNLDSGLVLSLPVASTVSRQTRALFPRLDPLIDDRCRFVSRGEAQWTVNFGDAYGCAAPYTLLSPTCVYFLTPRFGHSSHLRPCDLLRSVWLYRAARLHSQFTLQTNKAPDYDDRCYRLAARLAEEGRVCSLENGRIEETADLLMEDLDRHPAGDRQPCLS